MAPVVRVEPNGIQTLLLYDDAREDLESNGWLVFLRKFQGFNLQTAQEFTFSFDGCRAKVGDVQLEVTEDFLSQATGLPASGQRWFKNAKVEEVPWSLLFTSRKIKGCDKGMPISLLKVRWHGLLAVLKQFVTCEGRFGLVFLYHLRLLMIFMGFPLNMSYYLLRSLYKMGKRYRKQRSDSSLFHHGLIKILLVHQLELQNDNWDSFLIRNGFSNPNVEEIDKSVIEETLIYPTTPLSPTQACVSASYNKPLLDPKVIEQTHGQATHLNDSVKNLKKSTGKISKSNVDINFKNKRAGRLISRRLRNKSNSHASSISMIEVHESSDSKIDRFLAEEDPLSFEPHLDRPYNFVDNLPPCLKHNAEFPGIKLGNESTVHVEDAPVHNHVCSQETVAQSKCEVCRFWIDKYYTDVPILQSQVKALTDQIDALTNKNHRLESVFQGKEKRMKTTGNVIFKNVEAATTIVNSKIV
jgi:hypothetical protein